MAQPIEATIDLVRKAQAGDPGARNELFGRYSERVLDIVRIRMHKKLRRREESRDLLQTAMKEALVGLNAFEMRGESSLIRWLARVAERAILNRLDYQTAQARNVDCEVSLEGAGRARDGTSAPLRIEGRESTPSVELAREEESELVRQCIAGLPDRYREVIVMRDYEDVDWPEVAARLEVPSINAARMVHLRAVEKLGECLRKLGAGPVLRS
jgi:RNA polymerase sigma-70 factor (ECF subfamily)